MRAIYKRELRSYFHSMIGYVFIAFLVAYTGIYFLAYNLNYGYPYFSYVLSGILFVYLVAIPILTMRCFAEDKKNKTDQMLLTAPVSLFEIVLGKYLAMVTVIGIPNVIFCAFPLIIKAQGTAYLKVDYISIGVFFLLGCVYAAIGMFLSALTESQMIAFISTFGILLILYLWNGILSMLPSSAVSGLVGVLIILTLIVVYIYQMTGNIVIAGVIEAVGVIAGVVVYFVKSSLYENLLTKYDVILPKKRNYYIETVRSQYEHAHFKKDLDETEKIIAEKYPGYSDAFTKVMNQRKLHILNMFVMKKSLFDDYCNWLFDILFELEKRTDLTSYDTYEARLFGFISERLFNVWLERQNLKKCEVPVVFLENIDWPKKIADFLKRKVTGKR